MATPKPTDVDRFTASWSLLRLLVNITLPWHRARMDVIRARLHR